MDFTREFCTEGGDHIYANVVILKKFFSQWVQFFMVSKKGIMHNPMKYTLKNVMLFAD